MGWSTKKQICELRLKSKINNVKLKKDILQKEEKDISTNKKIKGKNEKLNNNPLLSDSDLEDD